MNAGVIIQARTGSTRLPNKILIDFVNGKRIIDILLQNLKKALPKMPIIIATSTNELDDVFAKIAKQNDIFCFRGNEQNVLSRFIQAAEGFQLDVIIRICSDNPLLEVDSIEKLINAYKEQPADYVSFAYPDQLPTIKSHLGLFAELTTLKALKQVNNLTQETLYQEHVTNYIYEHPDKFDIKFLDLPVFLQKRKDIRFTVDTQQDFEIMQQLFHLYHNKLNKSMEALVEWVDTHPLIYEIMSINIKENSK